MESIIYNVILKIIEQMGNNVWLLLLFIIILIGYNKFKKEECNNKLIEIGILLLPGVIFYVIYIIGIVMAQKYICVTIIGWIIPIILKYILLYMMSSKDNKMMLVKFNDGRAFNYYYKDVDDNNDEIYMTIKIRNKKGNVIRIKKVKKSDVKEKVIYNQKPKITGNYISMKKGKK